MGENPRVNPRVNPRGSLREDTAANFTSHVEQEAQRNRNRAGAHETDHRAN
jgi:hypothetical protein